MTKILERSGVLKGTLFCNPSRMAINWYPWTVRDSLENDILVVGPLELSYTIPEDFNPIPAIVAAADKAKADALEVYQKRVAEINEAVSRFLAIEAPVAEIDPQSGPFNEEGPL